MSSSSNSGQTRSMVQKYVPAMATISLRSVLEIYHDAQHDGGLNGGYSHLITSIKATGTHGDQGGPDREDPDIGTRVWLAKSGSRFDLNYDVRFDEDGFPENPLNRDRIDRVYNELDIAGIDDAAVQSVEVLFCDSELSAASDVDGEKWHVRLESNKAEARKERTKIDEHAENVPLIEDEGFQYRVLNCRRLIDRRQELTESRAKQQPQFIWKGYTFDGINNQLGPHIRSMNQNHMGRFGFGKRYGKDQEDSLTLLGIDNTQGDDDE